MMKTWTITVLEPAPSLCRAKISFGGTYEQAVDAAREIWRANPDSAPSVHAPDHDTYWYHSIRRNGEWRDRNTAPHMSGNL